MKKSMSPWAALAEACRAVKSSDNKALARVLPYVVDVDEEVPSGDPRRTETLLHKAIGSTLSCVQLVLKAGADPFKPDSTGVYPLAAASATGRLDCVELLLAHGAGVAAAQKTFASALWCAAVNGQEEVLSALITWAPGDQDDAWSVGGAQAALVGTVEAFATCERMARSKQGAKVMTCAREIAPHVKDFESENVAGNLRLLARTRRLPVFSLWIEEEVARREAVSIAAFCVGSKEAPDGEAAVKKLRL